MLDLTGIPPIEKLASLSPLFLTLSQSLLLCVCAVEAADMEKRWTEHFNLLLDYCPFFTHVHISKPAAQWLFITQNKGALIYY